MTLEPIEFMGKLGIPLSMNEIIYGKAHQVKCRPVLFGSEIKHIRICYGQPIMYREFDVIVPVFKQKEYSCVISYIRNSKLFEIVEEFYSLNDNEIITHYHQYVLVNDQWMSYKWSPNDDKPEIKFKKFLIELKR